jgi:DNA polymerase
VTGADDLFAAYVKQRMQAGETAWILSPGTPVPVQPLRSEERSSGTGIPPREQTPASPRAGRQRRAPAASAGPKWSKGLPDVPGSGIVIPAPPTDLFSADPLANRTLAELEDVIRACTACVLCKRRKQAVPGEGPGDARLVVVGEGPGAREDDLGRPFVGRAGELLTDILSAIELPRERVFICNVVKCRPPDNRTPAQDEIEACMPFLHRQLAIIRPAVILAMGATAAQALLQTRQSLGSMRNQVHEYRGIPLIVTYHPAALLRNPNWKKPTWDDVRIARRLVDRA